SGHSLAGRGRRFWLHRARRGYLGLPRARTRGQQWRYQPCAVVHRVVRSDPLFRPRLARLHRSRLDSSAVRCRQNQRWSNRSSLGVEPSQLHSRNQAVPWHRAESSQPAHVTSHESPENVLAWLALHIERHALFVAINREEVGCLVALKWRRKGTGIVTFARPLDLDHLGAKIAEHHGAVGPREYSREIKH